MKTKLLGILMLAFAGHLGAATLVTNGDFTTDCSGWGTTNTDGSFCQVGAGQTLGAGNPGGWVSLNNAPSPVPTMSQTIAGLTIGSQYTLSWDMQSAFKCCGSTSADGVSVAIDGNTYLFTVPRTMTWQSFSRSFTFTGASNVLTFSTQLNSTDQDAGFDNIAINAVTPGAVPEPASLLLAAIGLGLVSGISKLARR